MWATNTPRSAVVAEAAASPSPDGPPRCGRTNVASDAYGTQIHPSEGPAGTEVSFSGTTVRGEDWRWAPSDRLEAWWNSSVPPSEVPGGRPIKPGAIYQVARVDDMERCSFATTFEVPHVGPGRYEISVFVWEANPDDGYGWFPSHHFTVTAGPGSDAFGRADRD